MFLFVTFTQNFKNVIVIIFLELFSYEHLSNKVWVFFLMDIIFKITLDHNLNLIFLLGNYLISYNLVMNFQSLGN
jgi:hypothetical protein